MKLKSRLALRLTELAAALVALAVASARLGADVGTCSGVNITLPFNDVSGDAFFCQIAEAFFSGSDSGTSTSTFSPSQVVTCDQVAASITQTLDVSLSRGNRRSALGHFWIGGPRAPLELQMV